MSCKVKTILHNRYRILKIIGRGGTSTVYLAKDEHIDTLVAVKEISLDNPVNIEPVRTEIEMLKSLRHPMVPRIQDAFKDKNSYYIVSEYVEGITLEELTKTNHPDSHTVISMIKNVAKALMILHENDPPILYLDMKPSNVMVMSDGSIRLIDFGIATSGKNPTFYGTIGFAPPEQVGDEGLGPPDVRSDVFSLGMTYLVARTGFKPDENIDRTLDYVRIEQSLSKKEKSFLYRCINAQRSKRFATMRDVLENLNHIEKNHLSVRKKTIIPIMIFSLISIGTYIGIYRYRNYVNQRNAGEMLKAASEYVENGEYTPDGIRVIAGYVDAERLDEKTMNEFTYLLARSYLETIHDYKQAEKYYRKLNKDEYPEAQYCIDLCQLYESFSDENEGDTMRCLQNYYQEVITYQKSARRYDNLLTVAFGYEWYLNDQEKGRRLAAGVLRKGLTELEGDKMYLEMSDEEIVMYRNRFNKRLDSIKERIKIAQNKE